jgi:hypothetical protein
MVEMEKTDPLDIGKDTNATQLEELKKTITVDTLHNDEGLKVLANYRGDETWTAEEEKKLTRKIDRRLLSILCVTYGLQYYDKAVSVLSFQQCHHQSSLTTSRCSHKRYDWSHDHALPNTDQRIGLVWVENRP